MPIEKISIVIPTRNEADNIDELIERLLETIARTSLVAEIVVVDDDSKDGTQDRVLAWQEKAPIRLIIQDNNRGLSGAVFQGTRAAAHDVIVVMDADLSHPAETIPSLVEPLFSDACDMTIGSRYVQGSRVVGFPWHRCLLSKSATLFSRLLIDKVADPMAGFFAVSRSRILKAASHADGFKIGFEILVNGGENLRVREVPIEFVERRRGKSKATFKVGVVFLQRLGALAGGNLAWHTIDVAAGMLADILVFCGLFHMGRGLNPAHFAGAAAAWIVYFLSRSRREKSLTSASCFIHSGVVFAMALFLRGGILGSLTGVGWHAETALVVTAAVTAIVNFLGNSFYVFPEFETQVSDVRRWRMAAVGIFGYVFLLRLVYFSLPNLIPQEAYYWNYSKHPDIGYLDHPPMVAWLIAAGTAIFGNSEFGIRIFGLACGVIVSGFTFALTKNLFGKDCAMRAVLLSIILPFFVCFFMIPDVPLMACWAAALYFLERALLAKSRKAWLGFGVAMGLGMLSKYTICLLGFGGVMFAIIDRRSRRKETLFGLIGASLIAFILFSPVIIWNAQNHWASFIFQGPRRLHEVGRFASHFLILHILMLLTPIGLIGFLLGAFSGVFTVPSVRKTKGMYSRWLFVLAFTFVPLSVFFCVQSETSAITPLDRSDLVGRCSIHCVYNDAAAASQVYGIG